MTKRKVYTITSRNTSSWVCPVDFDGRREMSSLSLKTVVVHRSITSLMIEANLRKIINTVTYFNLVFVPFLATRYVCYDQSTKFYSLILIFSTLCVVHDLIFQRKLSRRRLPITFVYFVSHASAQALRPIPFMQRLRTTQHLISFQLL